MKENLNAGKLEGFKKFAGEIVGEVGERIARRFRDREDSVESKDDGSPVTEADREAEEILRGRISVKFPSHGFIGEEFGNENEQAEFVWVLDPIDGTKSFIHGVPLFGTLIGLLYRGSPILGLIHQPVLDRLVVGDNRSAFLNGRMTSVREARPLDRATVLLTDPADPFFHHAGDPFRRFQEEAAVVRSWGDCFGYLQLASGRADVMIDPILSPWDLLPLLPILRGAGAVVTGVDGSSPEETQSIAASTCGELHQRVLAALGGKRTNG